MPIGHEFTARGTDSVRICLAIKGNGHTPVKVQYADCVPSVAFIYTFWVSSIVSVWMTSAYIALVHACQQSLKRQPIQLAGDVKKN